MRDLRYHRGHAALFARHLSRKQARRLDVARRSRDRGAARIHRHCRRPRSCRSPRWPTRTRRWYGVQFHPEVTHTQHGAEILRRFVVDICGCATLWTSANIIDDAVARIRAQVGADHVLLGLVRRRRFVGRRRAAQARDRRPADLRVRRYRPAALARRRSGHGDDGRDTWA